MILRVFPFCQFGAWLTPESLSPCGHRGDRGCGSGAPQSSYGAERTRTDPPQAFSCVQVASGTCSTTERGDETTMTNELKKDAVYCVHFPEGEDLPVIKHSKNIPADWRACFRYEDDAKEFCEKIQASQAESYL